MLSPFCLLSPFWLFRYNERMPLSMPRWIFDTMSDHGKDTCRRIVADGDVPAAYIDWCAEFCNALPGFPPQTCFGCSAMCTMKSLLRRGWKDGETTLAKWVTAPQEESSFDVVPRLPTNKTPAKM